MLPKDPVMLMSAVNMKLRDEGCSLEEFCKREDIEIQELLDKLKQAGFDYMPEINQFR